MFVIGNVTVEVVVGTLVPEVGDWFTVRVVAVAKLHVTA
jgi:hypothetical protein